MIQQWTKRGQGQQWTKIDNNSSDRLSSPNQSVSQSVSQSVWTLTTWLLSSRRRDVEDRRKMGSFRRAKTGRTSLLPWLSDALDALRPGSILVLNRTTRDAGRRAILRSARRIIMRRADQDDFELGYVEGEKVAVRRLRARGVE